MREILQIITGTVMVALFMLAVTPAYSENVHTFGDNVQVLNLMTASSITASGNGSGVDLREYEGDIAVLLDVSAPASGTNPTMDVKIQHSSDDGSADAYADLSGASFTQVSSAASAQKLVINSDEAERYIRAVRTIGGTASPAYFMSIKGVALKKYK